MESKFEKMDDQDDIHTAYEKPYKLSKKHEKLYRLTTKKLSDVELDREELSTKFNEANQTIRPNCYKSLATQQSNGMIASGNQNQLQSSLAPLGDLLKTLMFLSNLNGFSPSPPVQGFNQRKGSFKVWKEKGSK